MGPMAAWLRVTVVMARRELMSYLLSPVTYILAALFLLAQGYSFWLLLQTLAARQGSVSSLLSYFFGGTFLYWFFLIFLLSVLTMRLFAPPHDQSVGVRAQGRDLLLCTGAPESALVIGKFAGAVALYGGLWALTGLHLALLRLYGGPAAMPTGGVLLCGYLGILLTGQSALSLGLLSSVIAPSQLLSSALSFIALSLLLLGGLWAEVPLGSSGDGALLSSALSYVSSLSHMDELGRGILDSRRVVYHVSLSCVCLTAATLLLRVRPGDRRGQARAVALSLAGVLVAVGVNVLSAQRPLRGDLTAAREHSLSPMLQGILRSLPVRVRITQLVAENDGVARDEIDLRLRETLLRAAQIAGDRLSVVRLDLDRQREQVRLLAQVHHIGRDDLRTGALIVARDGGSPDGAVYVLRRDALAVHDRVENDGPLPAEPRLRTYLGDGALLTALRHVIRDRIPRICFTHGHGEAEHDSLTGSGLSEWSKALSAGALQVRALDVLAPDVTAAGAADAGGAIRRDCDVVVVAGPERPFLPQESAALAAFLDGGGRALFLLGALIDRDLTHFLDTGLEAVLRARGLDPGQAVVLDPAARVGSTLAFVVEQGYAGHPITAALAGARTLWPLSRPVGVARSSAAGDGADATRGRRWQAQPLIWTGEGGILLHDLAALRAASAQRENPQPLPGAGLPRGTQTIAAVAQQQDGRGRLVVFGSAQIAWNDSLALYNRDLLVAAVRWLSDDSAAAAPAGMALSQMRLVLTDAQQGRLFVLLVIALPLWILLCGVGVRWMRRTS